MRFKLHLALVNPQQNMMPLSYQTELSSWFHKAVNFKSRSFVEYLLKNGFKTENQKFRSYTFSNLIVPQYKIIDDRLFINAGRIYLYLSFHLDENAVPHIINLLKKQKIALGDQKSVATFEIRFVEQIPDPEFRSQMSFKTMSPIVITNEPESLLSVNTAYLSPEDAEYEKMFFNVLTRRQLSFLKSNASKSKQSLFSHSGETTFELLTRPRLKVVKLKTANNDELQVRGYQYEFKVKAPSDLIRTGYYAGFGEKTSQGFGCIQPV
jgi:CRISPR-associated endoribonuclease Cas6